MALPVAVTGANKCLQYLISTARRTYQRIYLHRLHHTHSGIANISKFLGLLQPSTQQLHYKRTFLSVEEMKLERCNELSEKARINFGADAAEFKSIFIRELGNPEFELLEQDVFPYLHLLDKEDLPSVVRVVERYTEQVQRDRDAGLPNAHEQGIFVTALRRCHALNDPDTALRIYNIASEDIRGFKTSIALTMDLLFEHKRYAECVQVAVKALENGLQPYQYWFYAMSMLSAFRLNTQEYLYEAARIFDAKKLNRPDDKPIRECRLLALYCIKQNQLHAALTLINELEDSYEHQTANIKILAHVAAGNLESAFYIVKKLLQTQRMSSSRPTYILFVDVYEALNEAMQGAPQIDKTSSHFKLMKVLKKKRSDYVGRTELTKLLPSNLLPNPNRVPNRTEAAVSDGSQRPRPAVRHASQRTQSAVGDGLQRPRPAVRDGLQRPESAVRDTSQRARPAIRNGSQRTQSAVRNGSQRTQSAVRDGSQRTQSAVRDGSQRTQSAVRNGSQRTQSAVRDGSQRQQPAVRNGSQSTQPHDTSQRKGQELVADYKKVASSPSRRGQQMTSPTSHLNSPTEERKHKFEGFDAQSTKLEKTNDYPDSI